MKIIRTFFIGECELNVCFLFQAIKNISVNDLVTCAIEMAIFITIKRIIQNVQ